MRQVRCCVVGGGPAGMMTGYLLARAGVDVLVLEKHEDFLRDFRGDTIHPSTLEVMHELGVLKEFLERPHQEIQRVGARIDGFEVNIADLRHLPTRCKFIALMPKWEFLNFIAEQARRYPRFELMTQAEVVSLIEENGRVAGVRAKTPDGEVEIRTDLVIGADGRHSVVRKAARLEVIDRGAPIDVLWMRVSRHENDPAQGLGRVQTGRILITLNRGDYWQCAYIIRKGGFDEIKRRGLDAFRNGLVEVAPFLRGRTDELKTWDDVKLLTVMVDHLRKWYRPGVLCIGDAAHAMWPVGGVGINLAIQDAVAAANILGAQLREGSVIESLLRRVQKRREFPTKMTQRLQLIAHKRLLYPTLGMNKPLKSLPWQLRLLDRFPRLQRIPARIIGLGFRPEHVRLPER